MANALYCSTVLPQVLSSFEKSSSNYISASFSLFSTYLASLGEFILQGLQTNSKYEQDSSPISFFKPSTFFQPFNQFSLFFQQVQVIPVLSFYLQIRSTQTAATGFLQNVHIFLQLIFLNFCPYLFSIFLLFSSVFCPNLAPGPFKNTFHSSTFQLPVLSLFKSEAKRS